MAPITFIENHGKIQSMSRHIRYFLHKEGHRNLKRYTAGTLSVKESQGIQGHLP
jgi:hypothetical protein